MRLLLIVIFLLPFNSYTKAQEVENENKAQINLSSHLSVGGRYFQTFNINDNLTRDGLPDLNHFFTPNVNFDISFQRRKLRLTWSSGLAGVNIKEDSYRYRFMAAETGILLGYQVFGNKKFGLSMGSLLNVSSNALSIFSTNSSFSLNSINPINQRGALEMYYIPIRTGFMVEWSSFDNKRLPKNLDVVFTYQRVINSPNWQSDYAEVLDTVDENGQNFLSLSLRFLLFGR